MIIIFSKLMDMQTTNVYLIRLNRIYLNFIIFNQFKNNLIRLIITNNLNIILVIMYIKLKKYSTNCKQTNYFATKSYRELIQS